MNRIINNEEFVMDEMIDGYIKCYPNEFKKLDKYKIITRLAIEDKVSLVIGGGGGNEPWPIGFVGEGLADACVMGNVFTAPPATAIVHAAKNIPNKKGVLCITNNHAGDVLNFELAAELAELENIEMKTIYVTDDITSDKNDKTQRRGIAGISLVVKMASAATNMGLSFEEVVEVARRVNENIYTASVTTSPAYVLETGERAYELADGKIEYGMGFNGETGIKTADLKPADEITEEIVNMLIFDMGLNTGEEVVLLLNSFSATTFIESYIVANKCVELFKEKNIKVKDIAVDSLLATQGAGGFSLSILRIDGYEKFYEYPVYSPAIRAWRGLR